MRKNWNNKRMFLAAAIAAGLMIPMSGMAADGVLEGLNVQDTAKLVNFEFDKATTEYDIEVFADVYGVLFTPEVAEGEIEVSVEGLDADLALYEDTNLGFNNPEASKLPGSTSLTVKPGERFELSLTEAREANISAQDENMKKRAMEDDQDYKVTIATADQTYTINIHRPGTDEVVSKFQKLTWAVPDGSGKEMYYMLYVPEDYDESKAYPLLLAPHGSGQRVNEPEDILIRVAQATAPVYYGKEVIIIAPQCNYTTFELTDNENTWCDADTLELSPFGKGTMEIVEDVIANYNIDMSRIYCAGASMGGAGTIGFIGNAPELFAGGWICCQSRISDEGVKVLVDRIKDQEMALTVIYSKQDSEGANLGGERLIREFDAAGIAYDKMIYDDAEYDYLRPTNHFSWVPFFDNEANIDKLFSFSKPIAE